MPMFIVERNTNSRQKITNLQIVHFQGILPNYPRQATDPECTPTAVAVKVWKTFSTPRGWACCNITLIDQSAPRRQAAIKQIYPGERRGKCSGFSDRF